jgi:hypothetical protein
MAKRRKSKLRAMAEAGNPWAIETLGKARAQAMAPWRVYRLAQALVSHA